MDITSGGLIQRTPNDLSCQPCGCDAGANHKCERHEREEKGTAVLDASEMEYIRKAVLALDGHSVRSGGAAEAVKPAPLAVGIGGAPTRARIIPKTAAERKQYPIATGFFDYFPDAIAAIANLSWVGNNQHNPGMPLHWDRSKSADEADTCMRHFAERGTRDTDGVRHTVKFAWRALAILQKEIEAELLLEGK